MVCKSRSKLSCRKSLYETSSSSITELFDDFKVQSFVFFLVTGKPVGIVHARNFFHSVDKLDNWRECLIKKMFIVSVSEAARKSKIVPSVFSLQFFCFATTHFQIAVGIIRNDDYCISGVSFEKLLSSTSTLKVPSGLEMMHENVCRFSTADVESSVDKNCVETSSE